MKTAIKHQAFLDLEEALAARFRNAWAQYWGEVSKDIVQLTAARRFDDAHRRAESIDLGPIFDKARPHVRTIGMAAVLLGASRVRPRVKQTKVAKFPPKRQLDTFIAQLHTMLARNASQALRDMAHQWIEGEEQALRKSDETSPLYVSRKVLNANELIVWAKSQGFETTVPAEDMHVTIAYSRKPVEFARWLRAETPLAITGHQRWVTPLGDKGAVVLKFESNLLQARWREFIDGGCSWDYEGFQPHVTITYTGTEGLDPAKVEPYTGQILLGPEIFEPLVEDWADDLVEKRERPNLQVKINVAGRNFFALAASVQVSRLSAFGFLAEAAEAGIRNYRIDAVLDERTCEVCKHMDGWVFPVESGMALAAQIMDTQDPDALKQLAPFYAQNKASLSVLPSYTTEDFIDEGMILPPYHPLCRCIVVPTDDAAEVHPTDLSSRVALASQALYGDGDGAELTRRLFGVEPTETAVDALPEVASPEWVAQWLDRLTTPVESPAGPAEARSWPEEVMRRLTAQDVVQPDALAPPEVFGGATIPRNWALPFDPKQMAAAAASRWPWLAGILGWLAAREAKPTQAAPGGPEADDEEDDDQP